jgi:uncharacterized protein YbjT (DUF2867 family)
MVLVVGATGLVGTEVCRRLRARGEPVRALVRSTSAAEKVERLRSFGAELWPGDLKDPASLRRACQEVDAIVSTASSTLSRQAGDSIDSVDAEGQLSLVSAAQSAGIERFVFVSFRHPAEFTFPLEEAKRQVEAALQPMNFTILQASWFMEVWLSPALGFDYQNANARLYGPGTNPISWVSFSDVAEMCALVLHHPAAQRRTIEFGGPEALPPLEVIAIFEKVGAKPFQVEHVPEEVLRAQLEGATDPMQKSFAGLMLGYAAGDAIEMTGIVSQFGLSLKTVADYAHEVLAPGVGPSPRR